MTRLFIAIDLPEQTRFSLAGITPRGTGIRPVASGQIHLTLRFIGDVGEPQAERIRESLREVSPSAFPLTLHGVGVFPPSGPPRVIWVGTEPESRLVSLAQTIEKRVVAAGCAPEKRSFSPHITLARCRDVDTGRIAPFLETHVRFRSGPHLVRDFRLYSSTLSRDGSLYRVEAVYPLTAP